MPQALDKNKVLVNISSEGLDEASTSLLTTADKIHTETTRIVRKARLPPSNISREERRALKGLRIDEDIVILKADKVNTTVVMNTTDNEDKISYLLEDPAYSITSRNPLKQIEVATKKPIAESSIQEGVKKCLTVKDARTPTLYGLPKICKKGTPFRPIVSASLPNSYTSHILK
ncbi:hypothetical protein PR048_013936 [Dryococelus australis]|uniref:Uncharacterized protein n=1 Tax=Dryococelus australis TaxID=614101 RepID=A0ABQ9HTL9_9NEOP|nr:hypothetical protein PR048_013936 [Dryococelus australis]